MNDPVIVDAIAAVCHEANRAFCLYHLLDGSQPSWAEAPDWQRQSAIMGVQLALNPATTPEESHQSWLRQKLEDGWKYGPVKDPEKKEHPCMVPYHELPAAQRRKDYLFLAIARALLAEV